MHPVIEQLKDRKLVQWALAYLAGAFVVLQVAELVASIWGLPDIVGRATFVLLVVGFFAALTLAWYHGEKGLQRVSGPELVIIALLLGLGGLGIAATVQRNAGLPAQGGPRGVVRSVLGTGHDVAVARDGRQVAFVSDVDGTPTLYVRLIDNLEPRRLEGTEGAGQPFFSPDGQWIGFTAEGLFKRVSVAGGDPIEITEAPIAPLGASWGIDGTIVFAGRGIALQRVSIDGTDAEPVASLAPDGAESWHAWPFHMPDGDHVLFTSILEDRSRRLGVLSLRTNTVEWLQAPPVTVIRGWYTTDRYLIYADGGGTLWRARMGAGFDPDGESVPTGDRVRINRGYPGPSAQADVSMTGVLAYTRPESETSGTLVALTRGGEPQPLARAQIPIMLSPDGEHLAVEIITATERYIGIMLSGGGPVTRLTFDRNSVDPVWTPDGSRIAFSTSFNGLANMHWISVEGGGGPEPLLTRDGLQYPHAFTPDGQYLLFYEVTATVLERDIWMMHVHPDSVPRPLVRTPFNERMPTPSPNSRWFAYVSDETGNDEVYVQALPAGGSKQRISTNGGTDPVWSRSGDKLFFVQAGVAMSAAVQLSESGAVKFGTPTTEAVLEGRRGGPGGRSGSRGFDVSPSGDTFFYIQAPPADAPDEIVLVQGLTASVGHIER